MVVIVRKSAKEGRRIRLSRAGGGGGDVRAALRGRNSLQ